MIMLLSPSKNMQGCVYDDAISQPTFINEAQSIIKELNKMNVSDIQKFMNISEKLASINHERFKKWTLPFNKTNSSPAIYSFQEMFMRDLMLNLSQIVKLNSHKITYIFCLVYMEF